MLDARAKIIIEAATTQAQQQLKGFQSSLSGVQATVQKSPGAWQSLRQSWQGAALAAAAVTAAVYTIKKSYDATVGATVAYAAQVRNLSRLLGLQSEESSRLIQVSDDLVISQETLSRTLQFAVRKGTDVSIQGLGMLADQYNAIQDPIKRSQFLLQTFGRAGADMGKLLEVGSAGLTQMSAAQGANLILTQKQVDEARKWEIATDKLDDAWKGFIYRIGNQAIPVLNKLFDTLGRDATEREERTIALVAEATSYKDYLRILGQVGAGTGHLSQQTRILSQAEYASIKSTQGLIAERDHLLHTTRSLAPAFSDLSEELKEQADNFGTLFGMAQQYDDIAAGLGDITTQLQANALAQAKIRDAAKDAGYWTRDQKKALEDLRGVRDDLLGTYDEERRKLGEVLSTYLLNMQITKAAADGVITDLEAAQITAFATANGLISAGFEATFQQMRNSFNYWFGGIRDAASSGINVPVYYQSFGNEDGWGGGTPPPTALPPGSGDTTGGGGSQGDANKGRLAHGGTLGGGITLVGEAGPELIIGRTVLPANITRQLLARGVMPGRRAVTGGIFGDEDFGGWSTTATTSPYSQNTGTANEPGGNPDIGWSLPSGATSTPNNTTSSTIAAVAAAVQQDVAQQTAVILAALPTATEISAAATAAAAQMAQMAAEQQRRTNDKLDGILSALLRQGTAGDVGLSVRDAIQGVQG